MNDHTQQNRLRLYALIIEIIGIILAAGALIKSIELAVNAEEALILWIGLAIVAAIMTITGFFATLLKAFAQLLDDTEESNDTLNIISSTLSNIANQSTPPAPTPSAKPAQPQTAPTASAPAPKAPAVTPAPDSTVDVTVKNGAIVCPVCQTEQWDNRSCCYKCGTKFNKI